MTSTPTLSLDFLNFLTVFVREKGLTFLVLFCSVLTVKLHTVTPRARADVTGRLWPDRMM